MEMTRKTEIKKNDGQSIISLTPSSSPVPEVDLVGSFVNSLSKPLHLEKMKMGLRSLTGDGSLRLHFLYTEFVKKGEELGIAERLITQFRNEHPMDVLTVDTEEDKAQLKLKIQSNEEWIFQLRKMRESIEPCVNDNSNDSVLLKSKLNALEQDVSRLEEENKHLLATMEQSRFSSVEQQQAMTEATKSSDSLIEKLESALQEANFKIKSLEADINFHEMNCSKVRAELQSVQAKSSKHEAELIKSRKTVDMVTSQLKNAEREAANVQGQIDELAEVVDKEKNETVNNELQAAIKQEQLLREKCESRFDIINFGVQNIIRDFHAVKTDLINTREKNMELQDLLTASKADTKYYKDDGETLRKYIRRLEQQASNSLTTGQDEVQKAEMMVRGLQAQIHETEQSLLSSIPSMDILKQCFSMVRSIEDEFKQEIANGEVSSALAAVKKLKENLRLEKVKNENILAANSWDKLMAQNKELMEQLECLQLANEKQIRENWKVFEEEKNELEKKIDSTKSILKKVRRERDSSSKKWQRKLNESNSKSLILQEKTKELEEKLNGTMDSSLADESFRTVSDKSDSSYYETLRSTIHLLETSVEKYVQKIELLEDTLKQKEVELNEYQKTNSRLESRVTELQRSTEILQKRYDDEIVATSQQLESTENALEVQQELNAEVSSMTDELRQKHAAEVAKLTEECQILEENLKKHIDVMDEMRETRINLIESMESEIETAQNEKRKAIEEMVLNKNSLTSIQNLVAELQKEMNQVREWHAIKMGEVELADEQIRNLEVTNESLESKLKEVQMKLQTTQLQTTKAVSECTLTMEEVDALKSEVQKLRAVEKKLLSNISQLVSNNESCRETCTNKLEEVMKLLDDEKRIAQNLRIRINELENEIEKMTSTQKENEEAIISLAVENERKDKEYEMKLMLEKEQHEKLCKEMEAEYQNVEKADLEKLLDENELKLKEYNAASKSTLDKLKEVESELFELKKHHESTSTIGEELEKLKKQNAEKNVIVEVHIQRNFVLEKELASMKKQLIEAQSPRKDKVLQLENRLEVFQTSAKAQSKRYEEDLNQARADFKTALAEKERLVQQVNALNAAHAEELTAAKQAMSQELTKTIEHEETVFTLQKQILVLQQHSEELDSENKLERTGLINELIATKQKCEDFEQLATEHRADLIKINLLESHQAASKILIEDLQNAVHNSLLTAESPDHIDTMFPSLDPAFRQFLRLLAKNRNLAYGMVGFAAYAFLIHLYIFL